MPSVNILIFFYFKGILVILLFKKVEKMHIPLDIPLMTNGSCEKIKKPLA